MCSEDCRGVKTYEFLHESQQLYVCDLTMLKNPDINSVNYSSVRSSLADGPPGYNLTAVADDGTLVVWDMGSLRFLSEEKYRVHYEGAPKRAQALIATQKPRPVAKTVEKDKETASVHSSHSHPSQARGRPAAPVSPSARERRKQGGSPSRVFLTAHEGEEAHPDRLHSSEGHHRDPNHAHHPHGHAHGHHAPHGHHGHAGHGSHAHHGHHGHHGHGKHGHHGHEDEHHPMRRSSIAHHAVDPHADTHSGEHSRAHSQHGHRHHEGHHPEGYHYGDHHSSDSHHHGGEGHHSHPHSAGHSANHSGHSTARSHHDSHGPHHGSHHGPHHSSHGHSAAHPTQGHAPSSAPTSATPGPHPFALGGPNTGKVKSESGANWVELQSKTMFPIPKGQKYPGFLKAAKHWQAHSDSVPVLVPMHAHGCLLTMSLDGYHRVWNLDKQVGLGAQFHSVNAWCACCVVVLGSYAATNFAALSHVRRCVLSLLSFLCRTQCLLLIPPLNSSLLISLPCTAQCLGELALPNLTDQMKATSLCKEPGTSWRFILERIPVTKHHVDISQVLVKFLKQTKQVSRPSLFTSMDGCVYVLHEC
jgi:hypothetical protein